MASNPRLDLSLDDLIKKAKKKPAAGTGAKKAGGQQAGAGKKAPAQSAKGGNKAGQKQQQQQQQKPGAKGKVLQQQQQQRGQAGQQKQGPLKARGGIQKAGAGAARPAGKPQLQHASQRRQPDVRLVPRPGAARPGPARGGPAPRPSMGMGRPQMMPRAAQQAPRFGMGGYMGGQMMMQPAMMQQQPMMMMQQPMMQQQAAPVAAQPQQTNELFDGSVVSSKTSAKLLVSNLDYKVTDEDIKELFGTVGTIKESYIHYDKNGRSIGTATVVFQSRDDALTAFNRYNNVALDNKRMAIEVVEQAVPRGTFKTLASGINVSRPQAAAAAAAAGGSYRGRGVPQGDMMMS